MNHCRETALFTRTAKYAILYFSAQQQHKTKAAANFAIILPLFILSILKQVSLYFFTLISQVACRMGHIIAISTRLCQSAESVIHCITLNHIALER